MPSVDPLLGKTRTSEYDCLSFAVDAWRHLVGDVDVLERINALSNGVHTENGHVVLSAVRGFEKLDGPESPCFVVMQRTKTQPHIGVYWKGRVLHMKDRAVEYQPLAVAKRYFTKIGFYR